MSFGELVDRAFALLGSSQFAPAYDAFREALAAADQSGADAATQLGLITTFAQVARITGHLTESRDAYLRCLSLLDAGAPVPPGVPVRALMLNGLAGISVAQESFDQARGHFDAAYQEYVRFQDWTHAAEVLAALADMERLAGNRAACLTGMDRAIEFARSHGLTSVAQGQLLRQYGWLLNWDLTWDTSDRLDKAIQDLAGPGADPALQVEALLLKAQFKDGLNAPRAAAEAYKEALDLAGRAAPAKRWSVLVAWANFAAKRGDLGGAIARAEEAERIAREQGIAPQRQSALQTLIDLRLETGDPQQLERAAREAGEIIDDCRAQHDTDSLFLTLMERGLIHGGLGQWEPALADAEEALAVAGSAERRDRALTAKSACLLRLDRLPDALAVAHEAMAAIDALEASPNATAWRDTQSHIEELCRGAAIVAARLDKSGEALRWLELGTARLLRRELAVAGIPSPASQDFFRPEAPVIAFCIGGRRSMAIILPAGSGEPRTHWLPLDENRLKQTAAVADLSAALGPALEQAAADSKTLYIIPDPLLYRVPFAALSLPSGGQLVDRCASVVIPSLGVLGECRQRGTAAPRTCLAVSGKHDPAIPLERDAAAIAALWPEAGRQVLEQCTIPRFLQAASRFDVLHLACHGILEDTPDPLTASQLEFADGRLTARDVLKIPGGLRPGLVFLNACVSGTFKTLLRAEVQGFWRAFLVAGASAIVATLVEVDPACAQQIAESFYAELLGGKTKAESLRSAQLSLRTNSHLWASHILIGDGS
jgi:tetratricopeptide (TPR) repeat protein